MKPSATSLGRSADKIFHRIQKLRKAAAKANRNPQRFADYRYLQSVLRAHRYFSENRLLAVLLEIAPSILLTPVRANWHPVRVIIEASCIQPDLRMRSRWTRALEYAVSQKIDPDDLPRFLRANGGISGCADLASKANIRGSAAISAPYRSPFSFGRRGNLCSVATRWRHKPKTESRPRGRLLEKPH